MILPPDYQATLDYIFNYVDYERRRSVPYTETAWNLDRARRVLATLGNPHERLRFVHVAGSKGKGSTAANVESILRASGFRTGFYTSPHLHTFRERIRIDGQLVDRADVVRLLAECQSAVEAVPGITTFEIITVLALLHFAQQQVDWVVLEVGLGGRLDATNVVTPAVSVITPISYEHTALLGNTLDLIAREKAGIIKPGVPVVVAPQHDEALTAIQSVADQQGARLILAGRDWSWRSVADTLDGQVFDIERTFDPPLILRNQCPLGPRLSRFIPPCWARISWPTPLSPWPRVGNLRSRVWPLAKMAFVKGWRVSFGQGVLRCLVAPGRATRLRQPALPSSSIPRTTTPRPACCARLWRTIFRAVRS